MQLRDLILMSLKLKQTGLRNEIPDYDIRIEAGRVQNSVIRAELHRGDLSLMFI